MLLIVNMNDFIKRQECQLIHNDTMEQLKNISRDVSDIKVGIAELPKKIFDEADDKYAKKELELTVTEIDRELKRRTREWIKHIVTAVLGIVVGVIVPILVYALKSLVH